MCEFKPECLWDTARWVQLSNGMEGVCTLHGIACPAFSKDHDHARNTGLTPNMVDERYMNELALQDVRMREKENFNLYSTERRFDENIDEPGPTALDMGNYPTVSN